MKSRNLFKITFSILLALVFLVTLFSSAINSKYIGAVLANKQPCTCDASTGKCINCDNPINDTPCGANNEVCDLAQTKYSCENTKKFVSTTAPFTAPGKYLCNIDPNIQYADSVNSATKGAWSDVFQECFCSTGALIQKIINIVIYIVSGVALILLAIGAIKYITAQNNPDKITEAKEMITSAIFGLILILFSISIIRLLQGQLPPSWGVNFLNIP